MASTTESIKRLRSNVQSRMNGVGIRKTKTLGYQAPHMVDFKTALKKIPKENWGVLCTTTELAALVHCTRTVASTLIRKVPPEKRVLREFGNGAGRVSKRWRDVYSIGYLLKWWKANPDHYRKVRPVLPTYLTEMRNLWKINNANRAKRGKGPLPLPPKLRVWIMEHYTNGLHARTASMVESFIRDGFITREEITKYVPDIDL